MMSPARAAPPVLALVGPTAAGKSAAALEVAERGGAEIVAVDAFTLYRGMDIGTAKPAEADRARVPHHLLDLLDPCEDRTVQWFQDVARGVIGEIHGRGRIPLLVGGSGLYFRAVVDAFEFPPSDPQVRQRVAARHGGHARAAHAELARRDPAAAARIDPGNLRRSVRALEVLELTGRPFSSWRQAWSDYRSIYPGLEVVGIDVADDELRQRIARRVGHMLDAGWVEECRGLLARPGGLSHTARQAIGYAEVFAHVAGHATAAQTAEQVVARTRRFAVRQRRWFRRDPRVQWKPAEDAARRLLEVVAGSRWKGRSAP